MKKIFFPGQENKKFTKYKSEKPIKMLDLQLKKWRGVIITYPLKNCTLSLKKYIMKKINLFHFYYYYQYYTVYLLARHMVQMCVHTFSPQFISAVPKLYQRLCGVNVPNSNTFMQSCNTTQHHYQVSRVTKHIFHSTLRACVGNHSIKRSTRGPLPSPNTHDCTQNCIRLA